MLRLNNSSRLNCFYLLLVVSNISFWFFFGWIIHINKQTKIKSKIQRTATFPPTATAASAFFSVMTVISLNLVTHRRLKLKKPWIHLKSVWLVLCSRHSPRSFRRPAGSLWDALVVQALLRWMKRRMGLRANIHTQFHSGDYTVGILVPFANLLFTAVDLQCCLRGVVTVKDLSVAGGTAHVATCSCQLW